jgi:DNA-binding CsgD family transcriptional regulator
MLIDYILISMYAVAIVLGVVLINLNTMTYLNKKTIENRIFLILGVLIVLYLASDLVIYFRVSQNHLDGTLQILMIFSNICYYLYIYYWLMLLAELASYRFHKRIYIAIFGIYAVSMETIGLTFGSFRPESGTYFMEEGLAKTALLTTNLCFAVWLIYLAANYLMTGLKHMERGAKRRGVLTLSGLLVLYEAWTLVWDFNLVSGGQFDPSESIFVDPMALISIIYSISVIWIFYKKDPLGLYSNPTQGSNGNIVERETTQMISRIYGLTEREEEVAEAILRGLNNPEVGKLLFISENTVKRHMYNIFRKTGTKSRYEMISLFVHQKKP